jgi:hypothetical protein
LKAKPAHPRLITDIVGIIFNIIISIVIILCRVF